MLKFGSDKTANLVILVARILLVLLFVTSGWGKLMNFSGTEAYMAQTGAPFPPASAVIAIVIELFVSIAIILGLFTRPLAILMVVYTFATALMGHHYWTMAGPERAEAMINFYKNVSIMGGFSILYVTGAGRHSVDTILAPTAG